MHKLSWESNKCKPLVLGRGCRGGDGRAVRVDRMKPNLKHSEIKRLKLSNRDVLLSTSAFKFNLRHYTLEAVFQQQTGALLQGRGSHSSTSQLNLSCS